MHRFFRFGVRFALAVLMAVFTSVVAVAQEAAVTSAGQSQAGVVERLQAVGSTVVVDAPEALLERASFNATADAAEADDENSEEQDDAEKVVKTKSGKTVGYRVQVFADNNARSAKTEARQRERAIGQAFPSYGTYVSYASPYWRLRVGDFKSQYDAEKAAAEIRKAFPRYAREVRVVRDRIR